MVCPWHQGCTVAGAPSIPPPTPILAKVLSKEHTGQAKYTGALGRASGDFGAQGTMLGSSSCGSAWGNACFLTEGGGNNPEGSRGKWLQANSYEKHKRSREEDVNSSPLPSRDICGVNYNINAFVGFGGRSLL